MWLGLLVLTKWIIYLFLCECHFQVGGIFFHPWRQFSSYNTVSLKCSSLKKDFTALKFALYKIIIFFKREHCVIRLKLLTVLKPWSKTKPIKTWIMLYSLEASIVRTQMEKKFECELCVMVMWVNRSTIQEMKHVCHYQ